MSVPESSDSVFLLGAFAFTFGAMDSVATITFIPSSQVLCGATPPIENRIMQRERTMADTARFPVDVAAMRTSEKQRAHTIVVNITTILIRRSVMVSFYS
jgi:hypothetical protein